MKRDNKNIKVAKNCPMLVTVLMEFGVHSYDDDDDDDVEDNDGDDDDIY